MLNPRIVIDIMSDGNSNIEHIKWLLVGSSTGAIHLMDV